MLVLLANFSLLFADPFAAQIFVINFVFDIVFTIKCRPLQLVREARIEVTDQLHRPAEVGATEKVQVIEYVVELI